MIKKLLILYVCLIVGKVLASNVCFYCINCSQDQLGKQVVRCENGCIVGKGEHGFVQQCFSKSVQYEHLYGKNYSYCERDLCNDINKVLSDKVTQNCYFCLHCKDNQVSKKTVRCKDGCFIGKSVYGFVQQCHFPLVKYEIMFEKNYTICNREFCNSLEALNETIISGNFVYKLVSLFKSLASILNVFN